MLKIISSILSGMETDKRTTDLKVSDIIAARVSKHQLIQNFSNEVAASSDLNPDVSRALAGFGELNRLIIGINSDYQREPDIVAKLYPVEEADENGIKRTVYIRTQPNTYQAITQSLTRLAHSLYAEMIAPDEKARLAATRIQDYVRGLFL